MESTYSIELIQSIESGKYQKLCPNRIWHVWQAWRAQSSEDRVCNNELTFQSGEGGSESKLFEFLAEFGSKFEDALTHEDHSACSFDFCEFSSRNFTAVKQYHEPSRHEGDDQLKVIEKHEIEGACFPLQELFSDSKLSNAVELRKLTAWKLDGSAILEHPRPYLAISHVWSDGTGVGTHSSGRVNECLYRYFQGIALRFRCEGIWWDTLCIPSERKIRSKALDTMGSNYEYAKLTLVHDRFLRKLNFETPRLALFAIIMSPWFTRGWTALELAKSRTVKVIFKDSIKDLDLDILAKEPENPMTLLIKIFRDSPVLDIENLLLVLKARYTSWLKDRAAIAGLLTGVAIPNSDKDTFQRDTYQSILKKVRRICHGHLFHRSITMNGEFSWCATSLFELPQSLGHASLEVASNGSVSGEWCVFTIHASRVYGAYVRLNVSGRLADNDNEIKEELLCGLGSSHRLVEAKLQHTLQNLTEDLVLLFKPKDEERNANDDDEDKKNAVLVKVLTRNNGEKFKCRFVGSLSLVTRPGFLAEDVQLRVTTLTIGDTTGWGKLDKSAWETFYNFNLDQRKEVEDKGGHKSAEQTTSEYVRPNLRLEWRDSHINAWLQRECSKETTPDDLRVPDGLGQLPFHIAAETRTSQNFLESWIPENVSLDTLDFNQQSALHRAAWSGSIDNVKFLIGKGASQEIQDKNGSTALHLASEMGFCEVVKFLCDKRRSKPSNARAQTKDGLTPLHYAAIHGHYDVAVILLRNTATVDTETATMSWTPLHYAADNGQASVVELLLRGGANIHAKDRLGWTPLHFAAMGGHKTVVQKLLARGANIHMEDKNGWTPLKFAAVNGHRALVELFELLVPKAKASDNSGLSLELQAARNHDAVIHWVKRNRDQFDSELCHWFYLAALDGRTAVTGLTIDQVVVQADNWRRAVRRDQLAHTAAEYGFNGTLDFLSKTGLNVLATDQNGQSPLHLASQNGRSTTVQWLLSKGGKVNEQDKRNKQTPLHLAAYKGHLTVVQLLHKNNAATEKRDKDGQSPLHLAAGGGHQSIVEFFLTQNSNFEVQDIQGRTPLHLAAKSGHEVVVKLLINKGAEKGIKDSQGRTALWFAAMSKHESIMNFLSTGCGVNSQDSQDRTGRTPLHCAAQEGQKALLQWLVDKGYGSKTPYDTIGDRIEVRDIGGRTPLHHAASKGRLEVVDWLLKNKANAWVRDDEGRTPLHCAAEKGGKEIILSLLDFVDMSSSTKKAYLNSGDVEGQTPLHYASRDGHEEIVKMLLDKEEKYSVNQHLLDKGAALLQTADIFGRKALHFAALGGSDTVIEQLCCRLSISEGGINALEAKDAEGRTALHLAAEGGHQIAVERLIDAGAKANAKDGNDWTPLHYAATNRRGGSEAIIQRLVGKDPSLISVSDNSGRIPLHCAALNGHGGAVRCLADAMKEQGKAIDKVISSDRLSYTALL